MPESLIELFLKCEEPQPQPKTLPPLVCVPAEDRWRRYVDALDVSQQGANGSRACIVACLKILTLTSGDVSLAWPLLLHYNRTRCIPPWDEEAEDGPDSLRRKLNEALKFWRPQ